jgi:hypothetical protein
MIFLCRWKRPVPSLVCPELGVQFAIGAEERDKHGLRVATRAKFIERDSEASHQELQSCAVAAESRSGTGWAGNHATALTERANDLVALDRHWVCRLPVPRSPGKAKRCRCSRAAVHRVRPIRKDTGPGGGDRRFQAADEEGARVRPPGSTLRPSRKQHSHVGGEMLGCALGGDLLDGYASVDQSTIRRNKW